jgi:hypothetical protein
VRDADRHAFAQLVLPLRGAVSLEIAGREQLLDPLRAAFVAPGAWHSQCADTVNRSFIVDIDAAAIAPEVRARLDARPFQALGPEARRLIEFMDLLAVRRAATPALADARGGALSDALLGLLCALGALASWTVYAVANSRWLARLDAVSAHEWRLLTGVATGALALLLAAPAFLLAPAAHTVPDWLWFTVAVSTLALLCSVAGNALWNRASRLLPLPLTLTLVGQLVLFETLFALLYGFLWEGRWPAAHALAALGLLAA